MKLTEIYKYLVRESGIREQITNLGITNTIAAAHRLNGLMSLKSAEEVRQKLAAADRRDNTRCAWYALFSILKTNFSKPLKENLRNLVEWELMICEFSNDTDLLKAHGTLLKGMISHTLGELSDARDAYRACAETLEALPARKDLLGMCKLCMAVLHMELGQPDEAAKYYEQALTLAPAGTPRREGWIRLVSSLRQRGVRQDDFFNQLIEHSSSEEWTAQLKRNKSVIDLEEFIDLAKNKTRGFAVQKKYEKANRGAALVDCVLAFRKGSPGFRTELANYYLQDNAYAQAETLLRAMLRETPNDEELKFKLAHSLLQQAKNDESKPLLEGIVRLNPEHGPAHNLLGVVFMLEKRWELAKRHLETALRINPNDAMASEYLKSIPTATVSYSPNAGQISLGGDISSASPQDMGESIMAAILAGNPDRREEILKSIARDMGEETARRIEARMRGESAGRRSAHFEIAEQFFSARKFPEAIAEYELAIAEDSENWQAYMGLGDAYFMMGNFEIAAGYFEESLAIHPFAPTYRYLGDAYRRTGRMDKAIEAYQHSVDTDPHYAPANEALRIALEQKNTKR